MAKQKRHPDDALNQFIQNIAHFDFAQLYAVLSETAGAHTIEFISHNALSFPPSDVSLAKIDNKQIYLRSCVMNVTGPSSPLPLYFNDYICRNLKGSDSLETFLSIFCNRLSTLYYKSIINCKPSAETESRFVRILTNLLDRNVKQDHLQTLLSSMSVIAGKCRSSRNLKILLHNFFRKPMAIEVQENIGRWIRVENRLPLGRGAGFQGTSVLGSRVYDRTTGFRIFLEPAELDLFLDLLPGTNIQKDLHRLVKIFVSAPLLCEVEVRIRKSLFYKVKLGSREMRLGQSCILGAGSKEEIHRLRYEMDLLQEAE